MHTIRTQSPAIDVTFFGRVVSDGVAEASAGQVTADVVNLQIRLTRAPAEGGANSFSITLIPRRDYKALIRPGDWVRIKAGNNGTASELLLEGTVDIVGETHSVGTTGVASRMITVAGRDWSKVLTNTEMVFDTSLSNVEQGYLTLQAVQWFQDQQSIFLTPSDYIRNLLPLYLGGNAPSTSSAAVVRQFEYPDGGVDAAKRPTASMPGLFLDLTGIKDTDGAAPVQFYGMELSLLKMLRYLSHPVLNELWFETGSNSETVDKGTKRKPFRVVMREYPYGREAFEALDSYTLNEDECVSVALSRHSGEVYNFFRLKPTDGLGFNNDLMASQRLGYFLRNSINAYGLRRREEFTPFALFAQAADTDLTRATGLAARGPRLLQDVVTEWLKKITTWHCRNEVHYQGTIISRFRPDIRPGRRLLYVDSYSNGSKQFYIDTVTHTFSYPGPSTTSVGVSRGVDDTAELYSFDEVKSRLALQDLESTALIPSAGVVSSRGLNYSEPAAAPSTPTSPGVDVTLVIEKLTLSNGKVLKFVEWEAATGTPPDVRYFRISTQGTFYLNIGAGGGAFHFVDITNTYTAKDIIVTPANVTAGNVFTFK